MDSTIFEQDGTAYFAIVMNPNHARDTAKEIAKQIRYMAKIPRARMRVVSGEEVRAIPFGSPKKE